MTKPTQDKETLREAVARAIDACDPDRIDHALCLRQADAAIATMFERLRTPSLRCEPANGANLEEMRENLSADLKDAGDCKLVWVNEGDLAMLDAFQQENSDA